MGALKLLITGAAGYIGHHTVAEARARGHQVIALVRDTSAVPDVWSSDPDIDVLTCDLATAGPELAKACKAADVVLHCAASMSGDQSAHARDTLLATQTLLDAMAKNARLVHLSSIAVYGLDDIAADEDLTEANALIDAPEKRDAYAAAKLEQEAMVRQSGTNVTILRAGAVFGADRLWNAHFGPMVGPVLIRMESRGQLPLCHVSTCAQALVAAAEQPATDPINLLDDDLPDRKRYLNCLTKGPALTLPLNWRWIMPVARLLDLLGLGSKMPGLLHPCVLRARFLPLHYDNSRMRDTLGIRQAHGFEALMHEAQE